jgi:hypothetical protein
MRKINERIEKARVVGKVIPQFYQPRKGADPYQSDRGKTRGSRFVIAGLVPAISIRRASAPIIGMAGTSPAMTK